jgi:SAM-dependent methyltransferase
MLGCGERRKIFIASSLIEGIRLMSTKFDASGIKPLQNSALDNSFIDQAAQACARNLRSAFKRGEDITERISTEISKYKFYHEFEIIPGVRIVGEPWAMSFQEAFTQAVSSVNFDGKRVIDVGCRDGAMLFHEEEQGAGELVGVDNDPSTGLANFLVPFQGSKISCYGGNLYDLTPAETGKFDIVICCGLLYHLRYPMFGIRKLADLLADDGILILETGILDAFADFPLLFYPYMAESPYDGTSPTFFNLAGLKNAFLQASLSSPKVENRFNPHTFDPGKHFPIFTQGRGAGTMTIIRTIVTANKAKPESISVDRYFEGRHSFHTTGIF